MLHMYKKNDKRPREVDYDLIVIGSGAGGSVAAHMAAGRGKKVAIVEQEKLGGECPNYGCVPTKAILQAAETINTIREASRFGIKVTEPKPDFKAIHAWKNQAVKETGTEDGGALFEHDGIEVLYGHAHFLSPWVLSIGERRYTADRFLIATGAHDAIPAISGLVESGYIGYRQALELTTMPKKLFIIGGGAIGCEFAHYFSSFGVQVELAEYAPRLLGREDPEIGDLAKAVLSRNGVVVHTGTTVVKVQKKSSQKIVTFEVDGSRKNAIVDDILIAAGKVPNVDIGLENAGVEYNIHGIEVTTTMQTSTPHIYAAGDVTGRAMFTHVASYQSRIAGHNMFSSLKHHADYRAVPRCVFLSPEFAAVGTTEAELQNRGIRYQVATMPISIISRATVSQQDTGFVKIIANKKGVVLGGSIVAPRAGEMIHELTLATQWRLKASKIDYTMHAYPTWSQAVRMCASKINCR